MKKEKSSLGNRICIQERGLQKRNSITHFWGVVPNVAKCVKNIQYKIEKLAEEDNRPIKVNYEVFKDMTPTEKANMLGLEGWYSFQDVYNQVKLYLKDSDCEFDEIMDEAQLVYKGMQCEYGL